MMINHMVVQNWSSGSQRVAWYLELQEANWHTLRILYLEKKLESLVHPCVPG